VVKDGRNSNKNYIVGTACNTAYSRLNVALTFNGMYCPLFFIFVKANIDDCIPKRTFKYFVARSSFFYFQ